uniref:DNA-directed RNA polymerase 2A n=1 Tax=Solanum tuberosum TaxID=4113 RepID=M0ZLT3_SOLTU
MKPVPLIKGLKPFTKISLTRLMCQNLKMLLDCPLIFVSFHLFAVVGELPSFLSYTVIPPFA